MPGVRSAAVRHCGQAWPRHALRHGYAAADEGGGIAPVTADDLARQEPSGIGNSQEIRWRSGHPRGKRAPHRRDRV